MAFYKNWLKFIFYKFLIEKAILLKPKKAILRLPFEYLTGLFS